MDKPLQIIVERDVGMFNLVQMVVAWLPSILRQGRIPIVYFGRGCGYWSPNGYAGATTVWEYYFEPLVPRFGVNAIPPNLMDEIAGMTFRKGDGIRLLAEGCHVCCHVSGDPSTRKDDLGIQYKWFDPSKRLRRSVQPLIEQYVRPRAYIKEKVDSFFEGNMAGHKLIGIHARGTDSSNSPHDRKGGSLVLEDYARCIDSALTKAPDSRIFVATDEEAAVEYFRGRYGSRVTAYPGLRHREGNPKGYGPTGLSLPAFVVKNADNATRNGEEVIIDYCLLRRCGYLIHNGSSVARMVLLAEPNLSHVNVHLRNTSKLKILRSSMSKRKDRAKKLISKQLKRLRNLASRLVGNR